MQFRLDDQSDQAELNIATLTAGYFVSIHPDILREAALVSVEAFAVRRYAAGKTAWLRGFPEELQQGIHFVH